MLTLSLRGSGFRVPRQTGASDRTCSPGSGRSRSRHGREVMCNGSENPIRKERRRSHRLPGGWRGPVDLVFVNGWVTNLELMWEDAGWARSSRGSASFSRLICSTSAALGCRIACRHRHAGGANGRRARGDGRGWLRKRRVFGVSEGGAMSALFAASYPERVRAAGFLRLMPGRSAYPRSAGSSGLRKSIALGELDSFLGRDVPPKVLSDERARRAYARLERQSASPSAAMAIERMNREIDIRQFSRRSGCRAWCWHRVEDVAYRSSADVSSRQVLPARSMSNCPETIICPVMSLTSSIASSERSKNS